VLVQPGGHTVTVDLACGKVQHDTDLLLFGCLEVHAVEFQEQSHADIGCPLVAIDKGMIPGQGKGIAGRQFDQIGLFLVVLVERGSKCGFQKATIPNAAVATVLGQLSLVKGQHNLFKDPYGFSAHLARTFKTSRSSRMISSAIAICWTKSLS